jgi:hypothetical protein
MVWRWRSGLSVPSGAAKSRSRSYRTRREYIPVGSAPAPCGRRSCKTCSDSWPRRHGVISLHSAWVWIWAVSWGGKMVRNKSNNTAPHISGLEGKTQSGGVVVIGGLSTCSINIEFTHDKYARSCTVRSTIAVLTTIILNVLLKYQHPHLSALTYCLALQAYILKINSFRFHQLASIFLSAARTQVSSCP